MKMPDTFGGPNASPSPQASFTKYGLLSRALICAVGVDRMILATQCREQDATIIKAQGALFLGSLALTTSTLMLVSHKILSEPGHIRPSLLLGSVAVGALIGLADRYSFFIGGWFEAGVQQLQQYGGLDVSEGLKGHFRNALKLAVRGALSIPLGLLSGACLGTIVFYTDIKAVEEQRYLINNQALFSQANLSADEKIGNLIQATKVKQAENAALSDQITSLRKSATESSGDTDDQGARQELDSLLKQKAAAEEDVRKSQTVEALELGGISSFQTSGQPGNGPRHRAAIQEVANAKAHAEEIDAAVNAARARLDARRKILTLSNETTRQRFERDLPAYEEKLRQSNQDLTVLKEQLDDMTANRNSMIRSAVDTAPSRVNYNDGILAQLSALKQLGRTDDQTAMFIVLFEIATVALELAAVCSKSLVQIPTDYAKVVARDAILHSVKIVDEMMEEINGGPKAEAEPLENPPFGFPGNDNNKRDKKDGPIIDVAPSASSDNPRPPQPPKRRRGRPRKNNLLN